MQLGFVGTSSQVNGCPTVFVSERGTLVVQGTTVIDEHALEQVRQYGNGLPDHESCVELPAELIPFVDVEALQRVAFGDSDRAQFQINAEAVESIRQRFTACASERV